MDGRNQQYLDMIMCHPCMGFTGSESEEALGGSSESEPAMPARPRGKRSRAAEVHNLSEKRRRCRINEKMKALQSLIPNSSKTDKASMLDDAIEYLKQLQLQVQMLCMRNGLHLTPVNLSGLAESLPASQVYAALNQNSVEASNPPVSLLSLKQFSGAHHSLDPPNYDPCHNKHLMFPSVPSTSSPDPRLLLESSDPNLHSFPLTVSAEMIVQEDVVSNQCSSACQGTTSVPGGHDMKAARHRQETPIVRADHFDTRSIWKKQAPDLVPKDKDRVLFMPYLHRLQSSDTEAGLRAGTK